jgi:DNA-binding PadR family transcriptional regulator
MSTDAMTLYKLMILYMLDKAAFALTNAQITEFFLSKGYTNYFSLQEAINDLTDTELILVEQIRNSSYYNLSASGKETLFYFGNRIASGIRDDIDDFLSRHSYALKHENEITADYYQKSKDCYEVTCVIRSKDELLSGITMNVTDEQQAITICDNWKERYDTIYEFLIQQLMLRGGDHPDEE